MHAQHNFLHSCAGLAQVSTRRQNLVCTAQLEILTLAGLMLVKVSLLSRHHTAAGVPQLHSMHHLALLG